MSTLDLREPTIDPRVPAKALVVVELPREDLHPTAMTLVPVPILIVEMVEARRKERKVAEDQDQPV